VKRNYTRRAKRPMSWVLTEDDGFAAAGFAQGPSTITTVLAAGAVGGGGNALVPTRATVLRVKGQIILADFANSGATLVHYVAMGIRVVDVVSNIPVEIDPLAVNNGDGGWMWLWTGTCVPYSSVSSGVYLNRGSDKALQTIDVDIKSKRIVKSDQALCLFSRTFGEDSVNLLPRLRTLVSSFG